MNANVPKGAGLNFLSRENPAQAWHPKGGCSGGVSGTLMAKTFDVNVDTIFAAEKFARLTLISQAVEALVSPDERRRGFFRIAGAAAFG